MGRGTRTSYTQPRIGNYNCSVPASLLEFARINDTAAATSSRLQKQAILAEYLRAIDSDEALRLAARYCSGRSFPATDERVLGASGAIVSDAVISILHVDAREFWTLVTRKGEIGEALAEVWPQRDAGAALALGEIARVFEEVAATGKQERKREILRDLFLRCVDPREAAYLAKIIFSDLRTGVREGVLQAAVAQAFGKSLPEIQRAQLMLGDLDEVAVLARHDRLAEARFRLFHPIQFMLATPQESAQQVSETTNGRSYFAEDKLDGIRAQVHRDGDRIAIYTRTMDRIDPSFPDLVSTLQKGSGTFLLDGEIVPYRDGVVLPFAHIQKRLGRKGITRRILRENPAVFIAFDILYHDGELLMDRSLRERRAILDKICRSEPCSVTSLSTGVRPLGQAQGDHKDRPCILSTCAVPVTTAAEIDAAFSKARDCGNEGLVLKDPDSSYSPGRRGRAWLKLKTHLPTIDCVVTAAEYGHGKRRGVLSDYTFAVWDREPAEAGAKLVNIGKAFSGVTDEEIAQLTSIFLELSIAQRGQLHVVQPKVVLEIACDQIQKSNRHESGYALRFPRIKRIRWDKPPEEADRLPRIIEIYESAANTARGRTTEPAPAPEPTLFDLGGADGA